MAPRVGVVTFPGSNCEHDVVLALERLGAVPTWSGTATPRPKGTTRWCSPADSPTATTYGPVRSPGSPR